MVSSTEMNGKMYKKYANEKYSFLYLKVRQNPPQMFKNFTTPIDWEKYAKKDMYDDDDEKMSDDENE